MLAGMLYGGSKDAQVTLKLGSTPDKREQYRLMREARVTHGSIVDGVRLRMFSSGFCSLQSFLAAKRGVHDVFNVAGAGSASAAAFGLILPGSPIWRVRNVVLGSVMGAAICFHLGWLHLKLVEKANEGSMVVASVEAGNTTENKSNVGAATDRLEGRLSK